MTTHIVKIDCNTFTFTCDQKKLKCVQHTDFTGTSLEEDFPNGSIGIRTATPSSYISEAENINNLIQRILKNPNQFYIK